MYTPDRLDNQTHENVFVLVMSILYLVSSIATSDVRLFCMLAVSLSSSVLTFQWAIVSLCWVFSIRFFTVDGRWSLVSRVTADPV